jgi:hypothetical protein
MINNKLLKQILNSLNMDIPDNIEFKTIADSINESNKFKEDFSANEYSQLIEMREYKIGFTNRLMYSYSKPIQELEIFSELCKTIGSNIFNRINEDRESAKTIALLRLHQKSCLISSEIIYLIQGGYASGALSRWRTLFETSVISLFLALNDEITSRRYLDYEIIETEKELEAYMQNIDFLGFEEIPLDEQNRIKAKKDEIIKQYGKEFARDNGWASVVLGKKQLKLHDLIEYVDSQYMKPFYKFANNYVHSGAKSLMYNLGFIDGVKGKNTIASPSNIGFVDPAQLCALSFFNSTMAFLSINPSEEDLTLLINLYNKINRIANSFAEVEKKLIKAETDSELSQEIK